MNIKIAEEESVNTFCGFPNPDFEKAGVVLIPVPFDGTSTGRPGSRYGPKAILDASAQFLDEPWGEEFSHPIFDDGFLYTMEFVQLWGGSTQEKLHSLYLKIYQDVILKGKTPFLLGGEHSLSYSNLKALYQVVGNFSILHFDAHPDLRHSYHGDLYSHASAMRRSFDSLTPLGSAEVSLTLVGIRSIDLDVEQYLSKQLKHNAEMKSLHMFGARGLSFKDFERIDQTLKKKVYISFDLDAFDPSIMPAVSTPQPGGLDWYTAKDIVESVIARHEIIGMDVVELTPIGELVHPNVTAAKLVWHMLEAFYLKSKKEGEKK